MRFVNYLPLSVHFLYLEYGHTGVRFGEFDSGSDFLFIIITVAIRSRQQVIIESEHGELLALFWGHDVFFHLLKHRVKELALLLHDQAVELGTDNFKNSLLILEEVNDDILVVIV